MNKRIRNNTANDLFYRDIGLIIPANGEISFSIEDFHRLATSTDLYNGIISGDISIGNENSYFTDQTFQLNYLQSLELKVLISNLGTLEISAVSTSSSTWNTIGSLELTPMPGTYMVLLLVDAEVLSDSIGEVSIAIDNVVVDNSIRRLRAQASGSGLLDPDPVASVRATMITGINVTLNGSQSIQAKFHSVSGTITVRPRALRALRIEV